jgi:YbbR domain-containing protein
VSEKKSSQKASLKDSAEKLELAKKIANNSQKVASSYADFENGFISFFRRLLGGLSRFIFDSKFSKLAALILAVILYVSVNLENSDTLNITQASQINDIPVQAVYNSEIYEVTGIPETADVIVSGSMTDITLQKSQVTSKLTADLSGLTEGTCTVKLTPTNFISRLTVNVIDTPTITVTIRKKVTQRFNISYEFINTNRMNSIYTLSTPTFDQTEVLIRASQNTIDNIAFVKALIDVTDVTADFTRSARVVAYDQNGELVACDVIPETVSATVTVTSPSKEVPIIVRPVGTMPNDLAIDSITLDSTTVTIYASNDVLQTIDTFYIDLDVSNITKNTVMSAALSVPSGANGINITKVNMEITVGPLVSRVIADVPLTWVNYDNTNLKFRTSSDADAYIDVTVTGTQANVDAVTADDIDLYMDLSDISAGTMEVPLYVTGSNTYLTYSVTDGRDSIEIQVVE